MMSTVMITLPASTVTSTSSASTLTSEANLAAILLFSAEVKSETLPAALKLQLTTFWVVYELGDEGGGDGTDTTEAD